MRPIMAGLLRRRDAQDILNLTPRQLADATRSDLRDAVLTRGKLAARKVLALASGRVSPAEIAER